MHRARWSHYVNMRRDMDLVRLLLQRIEEDGQISDIPGFSTPQVIYHVEILVEAELLDGSVIKDGEGESFSAVVNRLTWRGHEFLDASRDNKIWKSAKEEILKQGGAWTFSILTEFLKRQISAGLGLGGP